MKDWTTLVQAEALADCLGNDQLVLLDCRATLGDAMAGARAYAESHVPGAVHADLERDLSGPHAAGAGRHPWPDEADFIPRLRRWGLTPAHQVVAYDAADGAYAARAWALLHLLGHRRVAVLDGGWARWQALGLPVESGPTAAPAGQGLLPAMASLRFDRSRLFDAGAVARHLGDGGIVLDARAAERFRGDVEPIDRIAGHVPGAINWPYACNLVDGRFRPATELAAAFRTLLGGREAGELVAMCGSGVTACHHLLAMEHAGLHGAGLYTGSWSGWIEDPARPVARGD